jgi:hypothetical protein
MRTKQSPLHRGGNPSAGFSGTGEIMTQKDSGFNHREVMGYDLPGIGPKDAIEDCSIGVQGSPGTVTVSFSTINGETLLVLDPAWADILADWLTEMAAKARITEPSLTLVKG